MAILKDLTVTKHVRTISTDPKLQARGKLVARIDEQIKPANAFNGGEP